MPAASRAAAMASAWSSVNCPSWTVATPPRIHRAETNRTRWRNTRVIGFSPRSLWEDGTTMIDVADTAWVLLGAGPVMLMRPGLGLFSGGMVCGKNVLSTLMHSFFPLALCSLIGVVIGYSIAFG